MGQKARIREVDVDVIRESDGSFAIACSALGVYAVGDSLKEAKNDFLEALDLHLEVLREKTVKSLSTKTRVAGSLPCPS